MQGPVDEAHGHLSTESRAEFAAVARPVEDVAEHDETRHNELLVDRSTEIGIAPQFDSDILGEIDTTYRHRVGRTAKELGDVAFERSCIDVDHCGVE